MKVNCIGWYGEGNLGDDSFQHVFSEAFSGHEMVFSQKPDLTCDAFILGGGGVIDDGYFDGLDQIGNKPLYAIGVDIPLCGDKYNLLLRHPFRRILVRSKEYFWLAREQGLKNVGFIPDIAFWISSPERNRSNKPRLGVSLMNHLLKGELHLQDHIMRVLDRKRDLVDITFFAFKAVDLTIIQDVLSRRSIPCEVLAPKTPLEMISHIASLDALLTMRFHGAVFADICQVPFISLSVPGKHSILCEQEDLHDSFLDIRDLNEYKLLVRLNKMLSAGDRGNPHQNHAQVRSELLKIRSEIEGLISAEKMLP